MASSSSSISFSAQSWKYNVFLSFRGKDTRRTFVDHLYHALEQQNIVTYKDNVTLPRGDIIEESLYKAIETSKILVVIFSENYADSSWCLKELYHIMKCRDSKTGQIVFPIFYHVDPSYVRKQKGKYGEAFSIHEQSEKNKEQVKSWKEALSGASNIAGWEPNHVADGHEAKCIQEIVGSILDKLLSLDLAVEDEDLVGMGTRLNDLKGVLRIGSGGVRMVGIWGIGGGGKTTLATSIYMDLKISGQFHGCCFVENIREESKQQNGLKSLQEKILSTVFDKKIQVESVGIGKRTIQRMLCRTSVLIVLDDVDNIKQLDALVGGHNWFGNGSRIIVTTRNEQVLISHRVDEVYPVSLLSKEEAIRLFKRHAYQKNNPLEDYEKLSLRVISHVNGLPLALKILGSFLYGKDKDEWISALDKLKYIPHSEVIDQLKISYDGLDDEQKQIFLDIACFHRGEEKYEAMKVLDACGFHSRTGVRVLIQKALITVRKQTTDDYFLDDDVLDMHDLIQEMGHYIVRGEHPNNPEKHSRLWRTEDIEDMCSRNVIAENDKIKAISVIKGCSSDFIMHVSNMKELRYICWDYYPANLFPESFQPRKLAVLKMRGSLQKELWRGNKYLPSLKELDLSYMNALVRTPNFGGLPCLQKLNLWDCESLEEIHESLENHSSLVSVHVVKCPKLTRFPSIARMKNLEILDITECRALVEFPKIEAKLDKLKELCLNATELEVPPFSVGEYCTNLISLELRSYNNPKSIEGNFHLPLNLRKLSLNGCHLKDGEIPNEIGELSCLQELELVDNDFTRIDINLSRLTRLKLLKLSFCFNLVELPELPSSLAILIAKYCFSLEDVIRNEIHTNCKYLNLVSVSQGIEGEKRKNIVGGQRLLGTMLQGTGSVISGCMILELQGLEIARGFDRLVKGMRCSMQLPENWDNHFSGFLMCAININWFEVTEISMKHEEDIDDGGCMEMEDWEVTDDDDDDVTCVGYIPFSFLRHSSWWDPKSSAIHMEIIVDREYDDIWWDRKSTTIHTEIIVDRENDDFWWGFKMVPKTSAETTPSTHSSSSEISLDTDGRYDGCYLQKTHDSKSAFKFKFLKSSYIY